jgi:pimeloyl-ACP methyl ester carboxylesterase
MGTAAEFSGLAAALSDAFTVWVPDRRGRGLSPAEWTASHGIQRDVEDLDAVLADTGARDVFGLSSGAIIALAAAARSATIHRLAVFEPPLFTTRGLPARHLQGFWRAIARGDAAAALTAAGKAVQLVPAVKYLPGWLMTSLLRRVVVRDAALAELALTLRFDFQIVAEAHGRLESWHSVNARVLLGGSRSPTYLKQDLDALEAVLPAASRVTLPGLDHGASWNAHPQRNPRGDPERVARELRLFFSEDPLDVGTS